MKIKYHKLYKSSDFEWLGDIPEHWKTKRLKDIAKIIDCKNRTPEYFDDGEYLVIRTSNVRDGRINLDNPSFTNESNFLEWTKRGVPPLGSILFTREAPAGEVCLVPSEYKSCLGQRMMNFIPNKNDYSIYLLYYFLSCRTKCYLGSITSGSTVHHLRIPQVFDIPVIVPPLLEQKTIAHYLDTKTAQIDRKIDLLTQKATLYSNLKQSLINETVTRGLDKTVPMKDSGIDAIDEVPEHWEVRRIKEIAYINKRTLTEKTPNDYEFDYIDIGSITYGIKGFSSERMTFEDAPSRAKRIVKKGDTIISTVRTYLKAIASIENDVSDLIVSTGFAVISPKKLLFSKYFSYLLTSNFVVDTICALSIGVSYPATNSSVIRNLLCLVPPPSEQKAIADYLDTKTAQIDQIIQTINTQIEKLKELRKTLINDVVTGKIKVVENEH